MSTHIDHIEITNFKSIRHAKIEGCKRINVFIGYPNVGKSAILEAISALSYIQEKFNEPFNLLCRLRHTNELFYNANIKNSAIIDVGKVRICIRYLGESEFNLQVDLLEAKTTTVPKQWDKLREIQYEKVNDSNGGYRAKIIHFTHSDKNGSRVKEVEVVKKYVFKGDFNEFKTEIQNLFSPFGGNLVDIIQFNKELRKEVAELFKFYDLKLLIDQATNSIRGLKQLDEETIFTIPFYQMADTLQRLIFHKAAIMSNENTVLLFEEPEAHMFPPYISKFTGDVIYGKDNGNQYFISTHSPFVMNDFLEDARDELSVYLVGLKNGQTVIKRLSDEQLHEVYQHGVDLFYNIESYLD